jgi:acyl-coenzyme A thioesterase 13
MVVDLLGSATILTVGAPHTGVSMEINVSYLDAAFANVSINPPFVSQGLIGVS